MHSVVRTPFQDFIPKISQIDEVPGVRPKFEFYRKSLSTLRSTVPHRLLNWFKLSSVNKVFFASRDVQIHGSLRRRFFFLVETFGATFRDLVGGSQLLCRYM